MAENIVVNDELGKRLEELLHESTHLILNIKNLCLGKEDHLNSTTSAIVVLAEKAGSINDRCIVALGHVGVVGADFESWAGYHE
jgi:hypothetical protein